MLGSFPAMDIAIINATLPWLEDADSLLFSYREGVTVAGSTNRVLSRKPSKLIDAEGKLVVPGLADAHMHLYSTAVSLGRLDLRGVTSMEELKLKVKEAVSKAPPGSWVIGRGWDQEKLREKRFPTRFDVDDVSGDTPVVLVRVCGHAAVLNTKALEKLGYLSCAEVLPGNLFQRVDGKLSGVIFEDAVEEALSRIPPPPQGLIKEWMMKVLGEYSSLGVTVLHSMSVDLEELRLVSQVLVGEGAPPIEYYAYVDPSHLEEALRNYRSLVRGVKIFADGSFGARTAALRERYSDAETQGILRLRSEEIRSIALSAYSRGLQTAVHAIGDLAVLEALRAAERLPGNAIRIEHASLVPPDIIELISKLKPEISVQPHFILSDTWVEDRLGPRARWVYAFKSLIESGATLYGSSDSPVEPLNPWMGIYASVNRGCPERLAICKYSTGEKLSLREALRIYYQAPKRTPSLVILNTTRIPSTKEDFESIRAHSIISSGKIYILSALNAELGYSERAGPRRG